MPWVRRRKVTKAVADVRKAAVAGPSRRVLPDGTIEEVSAAMGRVITVFADPRPRAVDLAGDGWERWREFRRRRGGD
jgi:hypothetical protein